MSKARILFTLLLAMSVTFGRADDYIKREVRSVWLTTVWGNDWPSTTGTSASTRNAQQQEMIKYLDQLQANNFNTVYFQVRTMCDAFYRSSYEPWSSYLVGTRGNDPGWDPLEFVVSECHKRGLECHAWVNPYRFSTGTNWNAPQDVELKNSGMLLTYDKTIILNPGLSEARKRIVDVCGEIVGNYDVDGLVFDDYFYPEGIPSDSSAGDYKLWQSTGGGKTIGDWRRANVNQMVADVYNMIQTRKPWVKFGISPAGVSCTDAKVAASHGVDRCPVASDWQYNGIFSDPVAWLEAGTIDYISPQLYWKTNHSTNPFGPLTEWWSKVAKQFGRHHYASHSISYMGSANNSTSYAESAKQIQLSREYTQNNAPGCVLFSDRIISGRVCKGFAEYLLANKFQKRALTPAIDWKSAAKLGKVQNLAVSGGNLTWSAINGARYSVYAIPTGFGKEQIMSTVTSGIQSKYLLGVSYTNSYSIPSDKASGYSFAVCALDRYGNEYEPAYSEEVAYTPVKDPAKYTTVNDMILQNLWVHSSDSYYNNLPEHSSWDVNRSFCAIDDIVYISGREVGDSETSSYLSRYDALTGEPLGMLPLSANTNVPYMPCNDVLKDNAGNLLIANMSLNIASNPLIIHRINKQTGEATEVASCAYSGGGRVDHCAVFGNVNNGNFTVWAGLSKSKTIVRWTYSGGKLTATETCTLGALQPAVTSLGISVRIFPKDNDYFYVSSSATNATLYKFSDGSKIAGGFNYNSALAPDNEYANGCTFFNYSEKDYFVYPLTPVYQENGTDKGGPHTFNIAAAGNNINYSQMAKLWTVPQGGLGSAYSFYADALADYTYTYDDLGAVDGVNIFVYVPSNGFAAYRMIDTKTSGVESITRKATVIGGNGEIIIVGSDADATVYTYSGAFIARGKNRITVPAGLYIAILNGKATKVVVK